MDLSGIYFPTSSASLYHVQASHYQPKHVDDQLSARLDETAEDVFGETGYEEQVEVCGVAGHAAFNSFNRLDKAQKVGGEVVVSHCFGPLGGNFLPGSTSSGLAYALALFYEWYSVKLQQKGVSIRTWPVVVASGEVSRSGDIFPVGSIAAKVTGMIAWLSSQNNAPSVIFVCHPNDLSADIKATLDTHNIDYITETQLPKVLKHLCGDSYHGDDIETNPFKGLDSFDEVDALRFFGRDKERDAIIKKLQDSTQPLIVSGSSGSGKSSLLKAGVIPKLRQMYNF